MSERDPLEMLSADVGRPVRPDPAFAANLLDRLLEDLADESANDANGLRNAGHLDLADVDVDDGASEAELLELIAPPPPDSPPRWGGWSLRVAAVVLLIVGGVAVLIQGGSDGALPVDTTDTEDSTPSTTDVVPSPQPPTANEQLVTDFLNARNAHDGAATRQLVADGASIVNEYGVVTPDDYLVRAEYDRLMNTEFSDISCSSLTSDSVSCLFRIQTDIGRHLRVDGYLSELVVTVRDGSIVDLLAATEGFSFEDDGVFFLDWLGRAHPEEIEVVADESRLRLLATPEAAAVVAERVPEFTASTLPPITTLLARDPRFTTLVDALTETRVDNALWACTESAMTLFAPTNDALDRHIRGSGLERGLVLSDVALLENFVVEETFTLADVAESDGQAMDLTTLSGDTITVTAGAEPRVQDVPIVGDVDGIAACNGVIHIIDDIYISSNQ